MVVLKPEGEYRKKNPKDYWSIAVSPSWPIETGFLGIPCNKAEKYINIAILQLTTVNVPITHISKLVIYQRWY